MKGRKRVAILISGRGSNMAALIEAAKNPSYPAEIVVVISNRPDAPGLAKAREAGLIAEAIDHKAFASRSDFEAALEARLEAHVIDAGIETMIAGLCGGHGLKTQISFEPAFRDVLEPGIGVTRRRTARGRHQSARANQGERIAAGDGNHGPVRC